MGGESVMRGGRCISSLKANFGSSDELLFTTLK